MVFKHIFFIMLLFQKAINEIAERNLEEIGYDCIVENIISKFITFNMGISDASVMTLSKTLVNGDHRCIIQIETLLLHNILLVIEFPSLARKHTLCYKNSTLIVHDLVTGATLDLCEIQTGIRKNSGRPETILKFALSEKIKINIDVAEDSIFDTLKITATSAKGVRTSEKSCTPNEILCMFADNAFCLTPELQCDGNLNCGAIGKYDEDYRKCKELRFSDILSVALAIFCFIIVVILIAIHCVQSFVPDVTNTFFMHNQNQAIVINSAFSRSSVFGNIRFAHSGELQIEDEIPDVESESDASYKIMHVDILESESQEMDKGLHSPESEREIIVHTVNNFDDKDPTPGTSKGSGN